MPPMFNPDGSLLMTAAGGPELGQGPIAAVNVARDGSGVASGMAAGDYKSVITRTGPGGTVQSSSSSFSSGGSGPAIATAVVRCHRPCAWFALLHCAPNPHALHPYICRPICSLPACSSVSHHLQAGSGPPGMMPMAPTTADVQQPQQPTMAAPRGAAVSSSRDGGAAPGVLSGDRAVAAVQSSGARGSSSSAVASVALAFATAAAVLLVL